MLLRPAAGLQCGPGEWQLVRDLLAPSLLAGSALRRLT
jgi:hypothetical protein